MPSADAPPTPTTPTPAPTPAPAPDADDSPAPGRAPAQREADSTRAREATRTILIVYFAKEHPLRQTIEQSLYAFARYSGERCIYLNLAVRRVPRWLRAAPIDLVVFHTTFLSVRWNPPDFSALLRRAAPLRALGRARVALPQDEYIYTAALNRFIRDFAVTHVYSTADASQWDRIYPEVDRDRVQFRTMLTGYLDPAAVPSLPSAPDTDHAARPIDIGYRAKRVPPWLGEHGRLKVDIADRVGAAARDRGLTVDISTRAQDTLLGSAWATFLRRCKYTIGVEGGASVLDPDGSIRDRTEAFLADHPDADFQSIRRACFAEHDGRFDLRAISPRHLEACASRTCQILIEGQYNGILQPNVHYIPLRRDFSNLDEVLDLVEQDSLRERLTERAWRDIVASGRFGYDRFVRNVIDACLPQDASAGRSAARAGLPAHRLRRAARADQRSWQLVRLRQRAMRLLDALGIKATLRRLLTFAP